MLRVNGQEQTPESGTRGMNYRTDVTAHVKPQVFVAFDMTDHTFEMNSGWIQGGWIDLGTIKCAVYSQFIWSFTEKDIEKLIA